MNSHFIPEEARQFILHSFDSIAQLEGLLLLREHPQTQWDAATVAQRIYVNEEEAMALLTQLTARGFVAEQESGGERCYHYAPATPHLEAMIGQVAELYRQYLIPVTKLIHAKSKNRIQAFADAFRIRKD